MFKYFFVILNNFILCVLQTERMQTTLKQKTRLVEIMERHQKLNLNPNGGHMKRNFTTFQWNNILRSLNQLGPAKDDQRWRVCWRNFKNKVKRFFFCKL